MASKTREIDLKKIDAVRRDQQRRRSQGEIADAAALHVRIQDGGFHVARGEEAGGQLIRVSDPQIIEKVLRLANMKGWADFPAVWAALGVRDAAVDYSLDSPSDFKSFFADAGNRELFSTDLAEYERGQEHLVSALRQIRQDVAIARVKLEKSLNAALEGAVVIAVPRMSKGRMVFDSWPYLPSVGTAIAYALLLLLDRDRPGSGLSYGERLRQCALGADEGGVPTCGRWFLANPTTQRGPLPKYCAEHRITVAAAKRRARVQKHRSPSKGK